MRRGAGAEKLRLITGALVVLCCAALGLACAETPSGGGGAERPTVLADTTFLADIVRNVAGDRVEVGSLLPIGADPHSFEPTPRDAEKIAKSRLVVINIRGLEPSIDELIESAGGAGLLVVEAAAGIPGRVSQHEGAAAVGGGGHSHEVDPHFWLDPLNVVAYLDNIVVGLSTIDPEGAESYRAEAAAYAEELRRLDAWIKEEVDQIPVDQRLLVTNHESLGYFADRYGFRLVGAIFSTAGVGGTPSPQQLAKLVRDIQTTGAKAIFLETGSNPNLAEQIARETGVKVVTELNTHSLSDDAPTYLEMMRRNVILIVDNLQAGGA